LERGAIYIPVGNIYTVPDSVIECERKRELNSPVSCIDDNVHFDSIVALDMYTGEKLWQFRTIAYEGFHQSCTYGSQAGCPEMMGPDYDVSEAPIMLTVQIDGVAVDALAFGSKSGFFWVIRRDNGTQIWKKQIGPCSNLGGSGWGAAYDGKYLYAQSSNAYGAQWYLTTPGRYTVGSHWIALDPANGDTIWATVDPNENAGGSIKQSRALGPITVANGVMYAGTTDEEGHMYAFNAETGQILWSFESGGSVMSSPSIVDGVLYWGSGYTKWGCYGNNQLYAFELP